MKAERMNRERRPDLNQCHARAVGTTDLSKRTVRGRCKSEKEKGREMKREEAEPDGRRSVRSLGGFAF